jgi:Ca-activated chloride channel family protein
MMDIKLKKDAIQKNSVEETVLVKLRDTSEIKESVERKPLNIGVAIDISGSMSVGIDSNHMARFNGLGFPEFNDGVSKSRIEQAKMVVLKTIDSMHDGDIISITAFNDKVFNVVESTELSKDNRYEIRERINGLNASGMTDLYSGWLGSVEQVAKRLDPTKLNRILLISDGDITVGVRDNDKISQDVRKISTKGISTSTFGIGSGFNEDLLQAMSDASSANSYYVEDEASMNKMFEDEFNDFRNIAGTDVSISFDFNDGVEMQDNMCDFKVENGSYLLPNIRRNNDVYALFKLKLMKAVSSKEKASLGTIKLKYKDSKGEEKILEKELKYEVVSKKDYQAMPENEEVMVQDVLMEVAKTKKQATAAIDNNNVELATKLLDTSKNYLEDMSHKYNDNRLAVSLRATETTLLNAKNNDMGVLRKEITSQTYMSTRSMV